MKPGLWLAVVILGVAAATPATAKHEQGVSGPTQGQAERVAFETLMLTDAQFLKGERTGPAATIWGELRLPGPREGRVPAVVIVHGTVGVGPREQRWAEELHQLGVATFVLDSFRGRGLSPPFESGAVTPPLTMIVDAYRALRLLASHPRIDPRRIALMGFSRGGIVALYASLRRFQRLHGPTGLEFAAYIPFYANCTVTYIEDGQMSDRPVRLHHGAADENVPVGACREYVGRLRRAGRDVSLTEYPGARHSFDSPDLLPARVQERGFKWTRCRFSERAPGEVVNTETGRAFGTSDPCLSRGPTVGYSAEAHGQALRSVKAFLAGALKL